MIAPFRTNLAIGFLTLSSCIYAGIAQAQPACASYNNFYLGGALGITSLMDKESTNVPIKDVHYLSAVGLLGGGLLGYDFVLRDQIVLGLEAFLNWTNVNFSDNQNYQPITSYKVNMRYNFGVRILPGYEFTPGTFGQLILGYANGSFNINDNGNYGIVNSSFFTNGVQVGLGLKTVLYGNFAIRGDIIYSNYGSQTTQGITISDPIVTQTYQNKLTTLDGILSIIYKIG